MRREATAPVRVIVADVGADVALVPSDAGPILVLRPEQSFESACTQVLRVLPDLHPDAARALVREHLPDAIDLPSALDLPSATTPPVSTSRGGRRTAVMVTSLSLAGLAVAGFGAVTVADSIDDIHDRSELLASTERDAFGNESFTAFTNTGLMRCATTGTQVARCTDEDGLVMTSEASFGPNAVHYTFSWGSERIWLRIFPNPRDADAYASEGATRTLQNLRVINRFVLWGTDAERIDVYVRSIERANGGAMSVVRADSASRSIDLGPRLEALVTGTANATPDPWDRHEMMRVLAGDSPSATPTRSTVTADAPARGLPPLAVRPGGGRHVAEQPAAPAPAPATSPVVEATPTPAPTAAEAPAQAPVAPTSDSSWSPAPAPSASPSTTTPRPTPAPTRPLLPPPAPLPSASASAPSSPPPEQSAPQVDAAPQGDPDVDGGLVSLVEDVAEGATDTALDAVAGLVADVEESAAA